MAMTAIFAFASGIPAHAATPVDLAVISVQFNNGAGPRTGKCNTVRINVRNLSSGSTTISFPVRYASLGVEGGFYPLATAYIKGIGPYATKSVTFNNAEYGISPSQVVYLATADSNSSVKETNESNNTKFITDSVVGNCTDLIRSIPPGVRMK
jgi:subtilase family serine protease